MSEKCPACAGTGDRFDHEINDWANPWEDCPVCRGWGEPVGPDAAWASAPTVKPVSVPACVACRCPVRCITCCSQTAHCPTRVRSHG